MTATLEQLITVRSQLVEEALAYLDALAGRLAELPAYYLSGFDFDRIRQRVSVSQQRLRYHEEDARAREAARRAGYFEDEPARERELERAYQWRGREMFEPPEEAEPTVQDWDAVREKLHRAVLLGDPGFGKTWLLKYEGRQVARAQHAALQRGEVAVDDVILPCYVRLGTLTEALDDAGGDASEAILHILQREFGLSDRGVAWARERLQGSQSLLLLDALDEVRSECGRR